MSDGSQETYSALVDGEAPPQTVPALIGEITGNPALRARWGCYHLIRDAVRDNLPATISTDLAERVRRAIEQEPTLLRPRRTRFAIPRPAIGLALAASVAAVAVFTLRAIGPAGLDVPEQTAAVEQVSEERLASLRWNVQQREVEDQLNAYLVNHSEYLGQGMRGMLPYARIVSYGTSD